MNEKQTQVLNNVFHIVFFVAGIFVGAAAGASLRACQPNQHLDTDTRVLQERSNELEGQQQLIDSAFERGDRLLEQGERRISDSKDDAIRSDERLGGVSAGLDSTLQQLKRTVRISD
jgi:uncharacterized membrane-anchored protein YhcB (DUF1043 family)